MKALTVTLFTLAAVAVFAQPADVNTLLKATGEDAKAQKYNKALSNLEQAKTELTRLLGDQYLALLPNKIEGWETKPEPPKPDPSKMGMSMPMMTNSSLASRSFSRKDTSKLPPPQQPPLNPADSAMKAKYMKAAPADTAAKNNMPRMPQQAQGGPRTNTLNISVSRNAMQAGNITKAHDTTGKQGPAKGGEALVIKGAKAFLTYNANAQSGTLTVLLGPTTVMEVRGNGIKSAEELTGVVKNLDIDKLKKLAEE
jgi:hypothetical protein